MENEEKVFIKAQIENIAARVGGTIAQGSITFPTTTEAVKDLFSNIGLDGKRYWEYSVRHYDSHSGRLALSLPKDANIDELNYLAVKLEALGEDGMNIFKAVVETGEHCGSVAEMINLIENLDRYDCLPFCNSADYADFLIDMDSDGNDEAIGKLQKSDDPADRSLAEYINRLEYHLDIDSYGDAAVERENGAFTEAGYLRGGEDFEEIYHGLQDIPVEYCVFDFPESGPPMRVESDDLAALLCEIHAVSGEFAPDIARNAPCLVNGVGEDYLLLINDHAIHFCEAEQALLSYSEFNVIWSDSYDDPYTRGFAFHITGRENGRVQGSITEVDIVEHITAQRELREESYIPVAETVLLSDLNTRYMSKAENPHIGYLRVAQSAARELLARGDAAVFRMMSGRAWQLSPVDAVRGGMWVQEHREFAIKPADLVGLEQWAKREVADISHGANRNTPDRTSPEK
ncbi:MAG: antirestriction protein ArdA [Oscillospiraceae bacterium]|nr:antirestriction protein ArdA [Oscillospiraceae bacterium]